MILRRDPAVALGEFVEGDQREIGTGRNERIERGDALGVARDRPIELRILLPIIDRPRFFPLIASLFPTHHTIRSRRNDRRAIVARGKIEMRAPHVAERGEDLRVPRSDTLLLAAFAEDMEALPERGDFPRRRAEVLAVGADEWRVKHVRLACALGTYDFRMVAFVLDQGEVFGVAIGGDEQTVGAVRFEYGGKFDATQTPYCIDHWWRNWFST